MDIKNNILPFVADNEKVFINFCKLFGLQSVIIKEVLITFSVSYDLLIKSLER